MTSDQFVYECFRFDKTHYAISKMSLFLRQIFERVQREKKEIYVPSTKCSDTHGSPTTKWARIDNNGVIVTCCFTFDIRQHAICVVGVDLNAPKRVELNEAYAILEKNGFIETPPPRMAWAI